MKVTADQLYKAFGVVHAVLEEKRTLPHKASYRFGRLFDHLAKEADRLNAKRNELITAHGATQESPSVPEDRIEEFTKAWMEVISEEIEVSAQPVPLASLGDGEAIKPHEFFLLGPFISEE